MASEGTWLMMPQKKPARGRKIELMQNDFMEGFFQWLDSEEGEISKEALDVVYETLENAVVELETRKIVWPDGSKLSIFQTCQRIHLESEIDFEPIQDHVLAWLEMSYVPKGFDNKQMEIFDERVNVWLTDYRNGTID